MDPLTKSYPWYTPYQFAGNKPIWAIDLDGLEEFFSQDHFEMGLGSGIPVQTAEDEKRIRERDSQRKNNTFNVHVRPFLQFAASVAPLTGDISDGIYMARNIQQGNYVQAAGVGVFLVPGADIFKSLKLSDKTGKFLRKFGSYASANKWISNVTKYGGFKIADALQAPRRQLQKALGTKGSGKAAHHLVPVELLEKNKYVQEAVEEGFDFNGMANGLGLGPEQHLGRHPDVYKEGVEGMIDTAREIMPDASPRQILDNVAGQLKTILDGTGIKVNDLFKKTD